MHAGGATIACGKQIPSQACLDCKLRHAVRTSQLITRRSGISNCQLESLASRAAVSRGVQGRPCKRNSAGRPGPDFGQDAAGDDDDQQLKEGAEHSSIGVQAALGVLWFYKNAISPLLPKSCRFIPTCSSYSVEAYQGYGFWKGSALTTWRVLRCNPFSKGGFDPPEWPPIGLEWAFGQERIKH